MVTQTEINNRIARSQAKRAAMRQDTHFSNEQLVRNSGLRIAHFQTEDTPLNRGMTVVWESVNGKMLRIATAICNPTDTFAKKIGTRTAIENFNAGNAILVPNHNYLSDYDYIACMFGAQYVSDEGILEMVDRDIELYG